MPAPTRAQIEADVTTPTAQVLLNGVDVTAEVLDIRQDLAQTAGEDGVGFGVVVAPTATVSIRPPALAYAWEDRRIEIRYGFSGSDRLPAFHGIITGRDDDQDGGTWQCEGLDALIRAVDVRSPVVLRRPIATRTTIGSADDPASPGWRGGLVNLVFWTAGGRPWEQAASYPGAAFYYACETALLAPPAAWLNGEDGMQALANLCVAAGGIVFQDTQGRMRYVEPFALAGGNPTYAWTDVPLNGATRAATNQGQYTRIRRRATTRQAVSAVRSPFVQRVVQGVQEIYTDRTPFPLAPGESKSLALDLTLPCVSLTELNVVAALSARARRATAAEVVLSNATLAAAQQITATITNTTSERVTVYALTARGQPLVAGEEGSARYSGTTSRPGVRDLELEESPYVQTRSFAERRCRMFFDFYGEARPIITLEGCGYDPDRFLGEIVSLSYAPWGLNAARHRIVALRPEAAGAWMDVDLVSVAGLPSFSDFFIGDSTYADSDVRQLAY